ncbi:uncharacterized protein [Centruroides vittatus]|uniref:uncharacterized protein n=1 Tax=Centruroides vittatus TaxID=120091 RepID=UPI00350F70A1
MFSYRYQDNVSLRGFYCQTENHRDINALVPTTLLGTNGIRQISQSPRRFSYREDKNGIFSDGTIRYVNFDRIPQLTNCERIFYEEPKCHPILQRTTIERDYLWGYERFLYTTQKCNSIFQSLQARNNRYESPSYKMDSEGNLSYRNGSGQYEEVRESTVLPPFRLKKLSSYNSPYITTNCSSSLNTDKSFKISFGCSIQNYNRIRILNYTDEILPYEECDQMAPNEINQTAWIPDLYGLYPELIAIASQDLRIFQYEDRQLILKKVFVEGGRSNPIISVDWNVWDPMLISTVQTDGKCTVWSLEHDSFTNEIKSSVDYQHAGSSYCNARFAMGQMEKCLIMIDKKDDVKIFDLRSNYCCLYKSLSEKVFSMECATSGDHLIAFGCKKKIVIFDFRNMNKALNIYQDFLPNEIASCFCWSPCYREIYIGTSCGGIINWPIDKDNRVDTQRYNVTENINLWSIHCPLFKPFIILTTGHNFQTPCYSTSVDTYLIKF